MSILSKKIAYLSAAILLISFSGAARAEIVRSTDGAPVLSSNGNCVLNNWEGAEKCEAAKAGMEEVAPVVAATTTQTTEIDQERTVFFGFNKASLTPHAEAHLDRLVKKIKWLNKRDHNNSTLTIVGYADRIGNADYNEKLALKRAKAVQAYLTSKGVTAKKIDVRSLGKTAPKANCAADMPRDKLIDCLKEDRRVEVEITSHQ